MKDYVYLLWELIFVERFMFFFVFGKSKKNCGSDIVKRVCMLCMFWKVEKSIFFVNVICEVVFVFSVLLING